MRLFDLVPDPDLLLGLPASDLGHVVLRLASSLTGNNGLVHPTTLKNSVDPQPGDDRPNYPQNRRQQIKDVVNEGIGWLTNQGLLVPVFGDRHGWMSITRQGQALVDAADFANYTRAAAFPRSLLHPRIAELVWGDLAGGDLDTAVFKAFREVEIAVREAAGFDATDRAVHVMRRAFGPEGVLSDRDGVPGEVEGLRDLFAGAIGSYKNPHSHRTVNLEDLTEAQEMIVLASHLLRIVESRRARIM